MVTNFAMILLTNITKMTNFALFMNFCYGNEFWNINENAISVC